MSTANEVLRWKERRTLMPVWISLGALFLFGLLMLMAGKTNGPAGQQEIAYLTLFWIGSSMIGLAAGVLLRTSRYSNTSLVSESACLDDGSCVI